MKRTATVKSECAQLVQELPKETWQEIFLILHQTQNERVLLVAARVNKCFYGLIDSATAVWKKEIERLRDEVAVFHLNSKYSRGEKWFICTECDRLYLNENDKAHADERIRRFQQAYFHGYKKPNNSVCLNCILWCEHCDTAYIASINSVHAKCGKFGEYNNDNPLVPFMSQVYPNRIDINLDLDHFM